MIQSGRLELDKRWQALATNIAPLAEAHRKGEATPRQISELEGLPAQVIELLKGEQDFKMRARHHRGVCSRSSRRQTPALSVGSLGISLTARRRRLMEKDERQGVAGLGHRVATLARYLSGHAACIFRNHFAETVPLDCHLLSGRLLKGGRAFSVNVLKKDQLDLAEHFGRSASVDKLAGTEWTTDRAGLPLLREALAWFECRLVDEYPAGDHILVLGSVIGGKLVDSEAEPLSYRETGAMDGAAALFPDVFGD